MRSPLWPVMMLVGAAGCRTARRPVTAPVAAHDAPTRLLALPYQGPRFVQREPDGFADVTLGSLRLQLRDDVVRAADDQPGSAIELAARVARGWVFVDRDGTCVAADHFTGPLTRVGYFPGHHREDLDVVAVQRGRVAVVDRDHAAWVSDGDRFVPIAALDGEHVEQVVFSSESDGVALTAGGVLRCTRDGGARWGPVAGGHEGALRLRLDDRGVLAVSSPRSYFVTACRLVEADTYARPRSDDFTAEVMGLPDRDVDPAAWLLTRHDPAWLDLLHGLPRPDGTVLVQAQDSLVTLDARTAREIHRVGLGSECQVSNAGHLLHVGCGHPGPHRPMSWRYLDPRPHRDGALSQDDVPHAMLGAMPSDLADLAVARDGCDRERIGRHPEEPSFEALCQLGSTTPEGRTRRVSRPYAEVVGVTGTRVLLSLSAHALGVVDLRSESEILDVEPVLSAADDETVTAGVAVGGVVTAVTTREGVLRGAAVGLLGRALIPVTLPPGAERAVFSDVTHGYAWSVSFDRIARTRDGGRHWEALAPPFDGTAPSRDAYRDPRPFVPDSLACTRERCVLDRRLAVVGWGPLTPGRGRVFLPPAGAPSVEEPWPDPRVPPRRWFEPGQLPALRCAADGVATALPPLAAPAAPAGSPRWVLSDCAADGCLRATAWREREGVRVHFAWHGRDALGVYAAASESVAITVRDNPTLQDLPGLSVRVMTLGRTRAVLSLVSEGASSGVFVHAPSGAAPTTALSSFHALMAAPGRIQGAGYAAVLQAHAWDRDGRAELVETDGVSDGRVTRTLYFPLWREERSEQGRWLSMSADDEGRNLRRPLALAERGDVRGAAVRTADAGGSEFSVFPGAPSPDALPLHAPWRSAGPVRPCAGPTPADAWRLTLAEPDPVWLAPRTTDDRTAVVVEARAAGVCLRAAEQRGADRAVAVEASADGLLRGTATAHDAIRAWRCEVQ